MENNVSNTTSNNIVTAEEPAVAFGTMGYGDVMSYIYRMGITDGVKERVGQRLMTESQSKYLSGTFDRVNHLATLKDNWDGEGASHVLQKVLDNIRNVLMFSDDNDWRIWTISPDVNGTLILQSDDALSAISLGCDEFSYLSRHNGTRIGKSHIKFSVDTFLNIMRTL
ncbi:MAG: hypothetical protein K6F33_10035 [Bacteroidales bacterium]|nr:hypothetical protein [Bacteroidales bacterium]